MRSTTLAALAATVALAAASTGCGKKTCAYSAYEDAPAGGTANNSAPAPSQNAGAATPADASRAIAEADIIQMDGTRLYAMSKSGSVAIVETANPSALSLLGTAKLSGEPFEMYRAGTTLLTMSNSAVDTFGQVRPPSSPTDDTTTTSHDNDGAVISALDVTNPAAPRPLAQFVIPGEIADSRMVGSVLYVATYENNACFGCGPKPRTMVTSFDVSDPTSPKKIDQLEFSSNAPDSYNLAWGMAWKRSIFVNDQRLYIGGHADFDTTKTTSDQLEGILDVVDITDAGGHLVKGAHLTLPGAVLSRWQMHETGGVLRVISQRGAGRTGNGTAMPEIDTFTVGSATSFTALGHATISLPRQEGLRTVRFDGTRAYAITFNQTDPLFALDLSDPANPKQKGQLQMPGWMFYLEPHGDRVLGLGVDRTDVEGSLNVSLFDVSDMSSPTLIKRVSFGSTAVNEDFQITNYELPEDQDRIQKSFKVFPDGLVVVPFSGTSSSYAGGDQCQSATGGIQLLDWSNDNLSKKALLSLKGNPRRAFEVSSYVIGVSDSNVSAFSRAGSMASDVSIGQCVPKSQPTPTYGGGGVPNEGDGRGYGGGDYYGGYGSGSYDGSICE